MVENLLESEQGKLSTTWKRAKVAHSLARKFQELGWHALTDEGELELKNHKCLSNKGVPDLLSHEEIMHTAKWNTFLPTPKNQQRMNPASSVWDQNKHDDRTTWAR